MLEGKAVDHSIDHSTFEVRVCRKNLIARCFLHLISPQYCAGNSRAILTGSDGSHSAEKSTDFLLNRIIRLTNLRELRINSANSRTVRNSLGKRMTFLADRSLT